MKHRNHPLKDRVKAMKHLILDAKTLNFDGHLIDGYQKELIQLEKEYKYEQALRKENRKNFTWNK